MDIRYSSSPEDFKSYATQKIREQFLIPALFAPDEINLTYSHFDRMIVGGVQPVSQRLFLEGGKALASDTFLARRELGAINVGGAGRVIADGKEYILNPRDGIYIGMGVKEVAFESLSADHPAQFYLNSTSAHRACPTKLIRKEDASSRRMGSPDTCNERIINQYVHPAVAESCQLCMGLTALEKGSNWNSMPCHTHERRMEVYFYFDLPKDGVVFHMMGQPGETRHVVLRDRQAVISPSWSIHTGVGTGNYAFIWGMAGENQAFDDVDHVAMGSLY